MGDFKTSEETKVTVNKASPSLLRTTSMVSELNFDLPTSHSTVSTNVYSGHLVMQIAEQRRL